jgi:ethanolamine ammonia-lyase large subunit
MKLNLLSALAAAMTFAVGAASANSARDSHGVDPRVIMKVRPVHSTLLPRERVVEVIRGRHIRFVGDPYLYNGRYVMRCYDKLGRLAYCQVDPYSGAFLGIDLQL